MKEMVIRLSDNNRTQDRLYSYMPCHDSNP